MAEEEWKTGQACQGRYLLLELYRDTPKSKRKITGIKCAPIEYQAGMSSMFIHCTREKCPVLRGYSEEKLTEETQFVLTVDNKVNRSLLTLQPEFNHRTSMQAQGIVEVTGGLIDAHYTLSPGLRGKLPRRGPNYVIA